MSDLEKIGDEFERVARSEKAIDKVNNCQLNYRSLFMFNNEIGNLKYFVKFHCSALL